MAKIIGIAGSSRAASVNAKLLRAAAAMLPAGHTLTTGSIANIPSYDGDDEAESGLPDTVIALKTLIASGDGLLLVTPEYNGSVPGAFKNAWDWCTRSGDGEDKIFAGRKVGVIGAGGRLGTYNAQREWFHIFRYMQMQPFCGRSVYFSGGSRAFDEAGGVIDEGMRGRLEAYMADFAAFVAA